MRAWAWSNRPPNISTVQGRAEAKKLSRLAATLYAAESMRLTTRLMQIASWLLLQRAANSGEMTRDQVASEKSKVRLDTASAHDDAAGWNELPADFVDLVNRSLSLQALVRRMDDEIYGTNATVVSMQSMRRSNPGVRPDQPAEHGLRARLTIPTPSPPVSSGFPCRSALRRFVSALFTFPWHPASADGRVRE